MATGQITQVPEAVRTLIQESSVKKVHGQGGGSTQPRPRDLAIVQYHPDLQHLYGKEVKHSLLVSLAETSKNPFFGGACVFAETTGELYITSGLLSSVGSSRLPIVIISQVKLNRKPGSPWEPLESFQWSKLRPPTNMPMPAGASRLKDGIVYCSQGEPVRGSGGLYYMPFGRPPEPLVTSYFGRDFNGVQDVVPSDSDSVLWFTDNYSAFDNDIRPSPLFPSQVYRYAIESGELKAVANDLSRPQAIAISNNQKTLYVSDLGSRHNEYPDILIGGGIFAYDIQDHSESQFLTNKRLFAYPKHGSAQKLKCDGRGNILAACADGVEVWNPRGILLGVFEVPDGATSFFMNDQEMFICSKQRLWWMQLK
ncbi:calcium-dependent phosphotriesterase [Zalerion maritima]|uniref:Calcium-dependent phosphotriesterase n=1 Tax=Zalerion maritima TaxID=339359 RepID=A0AAD5RZ66_9PEZI|nr:calcium-dependent phosphotriesterase [Zalerion maritima]